VIDITLPPYWSDLKRLKTYLNRACAPSIMIEKIEEVESSFHARYSAKRRLYRYIVKAGKASVFDYAYVHYHDNLDISKIQEAMRVLKGRHDFDAFSKRGSDPQSTIREIFKCGVYVHKGYTIFYFEANGYLRSQIRMMVDFLLKISDATLTIEDLKRQLEGSCICSRSLVSPNGLYLAKIKY